jgi:type IV pilus assembly protein PilW
VDNHNPTAAEFSLATSHDLTQGEILVVTDCNHSATFQMTNPTTTNVVHNTGAVTTPGNCTKGFGESAPGSGVPDCTSTNGVPYTFSPGSRLLRLSGNIYYIANNPNNVPSLYRLRLSSSGGNAATTAEELVEGVEDMQITYGVDTSNPATCSQTDGVVDTYVDAGAVTTTAPCATAEDDWKKVLSVRVRLLMRTEDSIVSQPQSYFYTNPLVATTATDRRLRKVFTTTIAVRNRL